MRHGEGSARKKKEEMGEVEALGGRSGVFSVLELFPLKKGVHSLLARLCQHGERLVSVVRGQRPLLYIENLIFAVAGRLWVPWL
jgi:hypothetical protein